MEEINNNNMQIIVGDTPNTNTQIIVGDTPINYPPNVYNVNNVNNDVYDVYDEYDEYDDEYNDEYDEYNDEYDENNELLYFKSIFTDLNLALKNDQGNTIIMYLTKKPFDDNMFNDEYEFDIDNFIDYLIADDKTDSVILNIRDADNQSLFGITLNNYLEVLTKSKRFTDHVVSRKDLKIKCPYEQTIRIDRTGDENDRNDIYNTNLEKKQKILLNRLKTIYSKLSVTLQNEIDEQYCDCKINFK